MTVSYNGAPKKTARRRKWRRALLAALLLFLLLLIDSNLRLVTTRVVIASPRIPPAFDGFTIVQLSDVHGAVFGKDHETLLRKIIDARPDLIAITGDLISDEEDMKAIEPLLPRLVEIAPVYYVTGNHEWDSGCIRELFALLKDAGVRVLRNEYARLERGGKTLLLAGIDDPNGPWDMLKPEAVLTHIREAEGDTPYLILLAHRNGYLERLAPYGADLILSGHAHGGMVRLPFTEGLVGPNRELLPKRTGGVYTWQDTTLFVSRGIGNGTGFPRFLNNPELAVIVLQSAAK